MHHPVQSNRHMCVFIFWGHTTPFRWVVIGYLAQQHDNDLHENEDKEGSSLLGQFEHDHHPRSCIQMDVYVCMYNTWIERGRVTRFLQWKCMSITLRRAIAVYCFRFPILERGRLANRQTCPSGRDLEPNHHKLPSSDSTITLCVWLRNEKGRGLFTWRPPEAIQPLSMVSSSVKIAFISISRRRMTLPRVDLSM